MWCPFRYAKRSAEVRKVFDSPDSYVQQKIEDCFRTIVITGVLIAMVFVAGSALLQRGRIDALPLQ